MPPRRKNTKKCVIHVGTHKTGTTTIQNFFSEHRKPLKEKGVIISDRFPPETGILMRYGSDDDKTFRYRTANNEINPDSIRKFRENFEADLEKISETPGDFALFIDEAAELLERQEIRRLLAAFRNNFSEISVIMYIRPQLDLAISLYTQHLRSGAVSPEILPQNWYDRHHNRFDYLTKARNWRDSLNRESDHFSLRLFDRKLMPDGDVMKDFASFLNLRLDTFEPTSDRNASLSNEGQTLLRLSNRLLKETSSPKEAAIRSKLLSLVEDLPSIHGRGRLPDRQSAADFMTIFAEDNATLKREFFPDAPDSFMKVDLEKFSEIAEKETFPPPGKLVRLVINAIETGLK